MVSRSKSARISCAAGTPHRSAILEATAHDRLNRPCVACTRRRCQAVAMWIMIAGPYSTGARTPGERADNLQALNRVAVEVHRRGHLPIIGVNLALPMI